MNAQTNRMSLVALCAALSAACVPTGDPAEAGAGSGPAGSGASPTAGSSPVTSGSGGSAAGSGDAGLAVDAGVAADAASTDDCPVTCAAPAPVCDPGTLTCVQCLLPDHCSDPSASRCNPVTHACEACRPNNVTDCDGIVVDGQAREICIDGLCLACLEDADCGAEAPVCNDNLCTACEDANDCDHIADRPMCVEGRCVQCETTSDCRDADEPGVCDVRGGACAATLPGVTDPCGACVASDQCDEGVCARMPTDPPSDDYRCMPLADATSGCAEAGQLRASEETMTVEGQNVIACVPGLLDCELLARQGATCTTDADCGDRARCEGTCVIACEADRDCAEGLFCKAGVGGEYCRP